jgi:hypothetical protein
MTREEAKELLPIITAFANGEEVQLYRPSENAWALKDNPDFTALPSDYRIAPKPRTVWVNEYPNSEFVTWDSHKTADLQAGVTRIACHEIELPPLP